MLCDTSKFVIEPFSILDVFFGGLKEFVVVKITTASHIDITSFAGFGFKLLEVCVLKITILVFLSPYFLADD